MGSARSLSTSPNKKARRRLHPSPERDDVPLFSDPAPPNVGYWLHRIMGEEISYDDSDDMISPRQY